MVGTLALDTVLHQKLKTKAEILKFLKIPQNQDFLLLTLHPISEGTESAVKQMKSALRACLSTGLTIVLIYPNADPGSEAMIKDIKEEEENSQVKIFRNLDYNTFLSLEKHAQVWVGNSSAGIVDSPSFKTPVVNVGPRQTGRVRSANILDVGYDQEEISSAIKKALFNQRFLRVVKSVISPWGKGNTSDTIVRVLEKITFDEKILNKKTKSI